eukprot:2689280-Amphidinium_carterae.1
MCSASQRKRQTQNVITSGPSQIQTVQQIGYRFDAVHFDACSMDAEEVGSATILGLVHHHGHHPVSAPHSLRSHLALSCCCHADVPSTRAR